ncbi:hypothetical protein H0H92_001030 [Tricholoma furcatifolium]|nr:hypothetical protein H0H92_001030 [Tricholoma furcatifolium]
MIDLTRSSPISISPGGSPVAPAAILRSSPSVGYGSGDEQEIDDFMEEIIRKADAFEEAAAILRSQLKFKNPIWLKRQSDSKFGRDVMDFVDDIQLYEKTGRRRETTWAEGKSKVEKRRARNTMGYTRREV